MRTFLLLRLKRHLNDVRKHNNAQKRGGGVEIVSVDGGGLGLAAASTGPGHRVEYEFDRRWTQALLNRALERLRQEAEQRDNVEVFEALKAQLSGENPVRLREEAARLGRSEGALRMALSRQRDRLNAVLREEVTETLEPGADVAEELRYLAQVLG